MENELRSLIEDSIKFMTHFKRDKLTVADIEYALKDRNYYDVSQNILIKIELLSKILHRSDIYYSCLICMLFETKNRKFSDMMSVRRSHSKNTLISGLNKMRYHNNTHKRTIKKNSSLLLLFLTAICSLTGKRFTKLSR